MNKIDNNTLALQNILATINALPEAGSGEAPAPVLQEKSVTPTEEMQSVTPDAGYDGLSKVNVGAIPANYEDVTDPLAELNTANGGTAAGTMTGAVDNTEALASDQESLIAQIAAALEGKAAGGGSSGGGTAEVTITTNDEVQLNFVVYNDCEKWIFRRVDLTNYTLNITVPVGTIIVLEYNRDWFDPIHSTTGALETAFCDEQNSIVVVNGSGSLSITG